MLNKSSTPSNDAFNTNLSYFLNSLLSRCRSDDTEIVGSVGWDES